MTYAWFDVTRNAGIARIMHMSYRSKTHTWNDVILVKRSMIRVGTTLILVKRSMIRVFHIQVLKSRDTILTFSYNISNDTWPDEHYRIAASASPDAHCVIALWRHMERFDVTRSSYTLTSLRVTLSRDFSPERHPSIRHIHVKTLHVSVIIIWPSSRVVLCAITTFSACLLCLSGMWLYVVYVYVCPVYLPMWCLVVNCSRPDIT